MALRDEVLPAMVNSAGKNAGSRHNIEQKL